MSVAEHKTKTTIVMEKELKAKLEELAKRDNRSFNNYMVNVLTEHVMQQERD